MTRDRYRQIKEAFLEALERPQAQREAFVAQRAAGDEELAREVRSLLLHHDPVDAPHSPGAAIDRSPPTQPCLGGTAMGQGAESPRNSKVAASPSPAPSGSASRSSLKIDRGRFAPGSMISARYRIVDLIARGGMGEVYRADDLKLAEPVALKFLPKNLANDKHWLDRFLDEIRVARNVSHPNVCRVYDVGEDLGEHFLTMEYVEGETLSSLQSRIGRLPQRKAEQIAQQLCAGLAAIHDAGVLHRDLKPSNILIDHRGQVKVTDFGLSAAGEIKGYQAAAGTPGYVAPESLSGVEATARSDIYQLGLLLFELFTGRPGYVAEAGEDLLSKQQKADPPAPSTVAPDIKPRVEQVIQQCLDRDPASRPASARQVARLLPGGDPLAAALEAGETPSPSMVAMAGKRGTLRPGLAAAAVGVFMILVATAILLGSRGASVMAMASLDKPPAVLADNARQILVKLGYEPAADDPGHEAWAMDLYEELIGEIERTDTSANRWERLRRERPSPVDFWYRWSPEPLGTNKPTGRLSMNDPPESVGGMIAVRLTPKGRLRELAVVDRRTGTQVDPVSGLPAGQPGPPVPEPDWDIVFREAGLERAKFAEVPFERIPPVFADKRRAWLGVYPESPDTRIRVEAATLGNRIVAFRTVEVGLNLDQTSMLAPTSERKRLGTLASQGVLVLTILGAVVLAFRNTRAKRGDRSGATRAAVVIAGATVLMLLLQAGTLRYDDVPLGNLGWMLAVGIAAGLGVWVLYVAVEPYVRRLWPESIISWTRLIQGRFTDPLVGQSLLVGALVGAAGMCVVYVNRLMPGWLGLPPAQPYLGSGLGATVLDGTRQALGSLIQCALEGVRMAMLMLVGVVLIKLIVRRTWVALVLFGLAQTVIWMLTSATLNEWSWAVFAVSGTLVAGLMALALAALVRYGVLALMAAASVLTALGSLPITFNFEKWHAGIGLLGLGLVCALAFYGAACAVVGRGK